MEDRKLKREKMYCLEEDYQKLVRNIKRIKQKIDFQFCPSVLAKGQLSTLPLCSLTLTTITQYHHK